MRACARAASHIILYTMHKNVRVGQSTTGMRGDERRLRGQAADRVQIGGSSGGNVRLWLWRGLELWLWCRPGQNPRRV